MLNQGEIVIITYYCFMRNEIPKNIQNSFNKNQNFIKCLKLIYKAMLQLNSLIDRMIRLVFESLHFQTSQMQGGG